MNLIGGNNFILIDVLIGLKWKLKKIKETMKEKKILFHIWAIRRNYDIYKWKVDHHWKSAVSVRVAWWIRNKKIVYERVYVFLNG